MNKRIADITLGEAMNYCSMFRACNPDKFCEESGCDLHARGICNRGWVHDWDISEPPRFTSDEVKKAKAIRLLFPDVYAIKHDGVFILLNDSEGKTVNTFLEMSNPIPSIEDGETVTLEEIINENK